MRAQLLQDFRVAQLALRRSFMDAFKREIEILDLDGIDMITLSDDVVIKHIDLTRDIVKLQMSAANRHSVSIHKFSDSVIQDIVSVMKAKALDFINYDIRVNGKGEIIDSGNC